jgi:hypothetical protein
MIGRPRMVLSEPGDNGDAGRDAALGRDDFGSNDRPAAGRQRIQIGRGRSIRSLATRACGLCCLSSLGDLCERAGDWLSAGGAYRDGPRTHASQSPLRGRRRRRRGRQPRQPQGASPLTSDGPPCPTHCGMRERATKAAAQRPTTARRLVAAPTLGAVASQGVLRIDPKVDLVPRTTHSGQVRSVASSRDGTRALGRLGPDTQAVGRRRQPPGHK